MPSIFNPENRLANEPQERTERTLTLAEKIELVGKSLRRNLADVALVRMNEEKKPEKSSQTESV
jgi:hypothetical protein